jgi:hypothetical protein
MMDFVADRKPAAPLVEIDSFLPLVMKLPNIILSENTYVR